MPEIILKRGERALVDEEFLHLAKYPWYFGKGYAFTSFRIRTNKWITVKLHHCVAGRPLYGLQIDHANGNRLDNRTKNLRIVTHRENGVNRIERRKGRVTSKFVGVCLHKPSGMWHSQIGINGKRKSLGYFKNEADAANKYQEALAKL